MGNPIVVGEKILVGAIESEGVLAGGITPAGVLKGMLSIPVGYEDYTGPYSVVPTIDSQSLNTGDKHLIHDVTIEPIPYYEVSNQNGKTIIIGGI